MQYYFLASRLPDLEIGQQPDLSWEEFLFLLETNLTERDLEWVRVLRFYFDLQNLRRFWLNEPLDPRGNYSIVSLEEGLLKEDEFPEYVYLFLDKYAHQDDRLRHFSELVAAYFQQPYAHAPQFIQDYIAFERQLRLILVGFRAHALNRDLATELQNEDPDDPLVAQLMAHKDAKSVEPPEGFEGLKNLFEHHGDDPLDLYQGLANYRFQWIEERLNAEMFSIDRILGYTIQLNMVLQWLELDQQKGQKLIDTMLKDAL